jgi:hypothetical protein
MSHVNSSRRISTSQHLGANGKAKLGPQKRAAGAREVTEVGAPYPCSPADVGTVEDKIKQARLAQLDLANDKAREEAAARSGRFTKTDDARQEMGRVAARLMTVFESSLNEFANAVIAVPPVTPRDALRTLRTTWREIRVRQAKVASAEAVTLPPLVDDEGDPDAPTC